MSYFPQNKIQVFSKDKIYEIGGNIRKEIKDMIEIKEKLSKNIGELDKVMEEDSFTKMSSALRMQAEKVFLPFNNLSYSSQILMCQY
jgi:hypothetical protein